MHSSLLRVLVTSHAASASVHETRSNNAVYSTKICERVRRCLRAVPYSLFLGLGMADYTTIYEHHNKTIGAHTFCGFVITCKLKATKIAAGAYNSQPKFLL